MKKLAWKYKEIQKYTKIALWKIDGWDVSKLDLDPDEYRKVGFIIRSLKQ